MCSINYIAVKTQQHYLKRFTEEYYVNKQTLDAKNLLESDSKHMWRIITDCELDGFDKKEKTMLKFQGMDQPAEKLYRRDLAIIRGTKLMDDFMIWPLIETADDEYVMEDIFSFAVYKGLINKTEIVINPFAWFTCEIEFYPNADSVKGLIDLWFQKWYYPKRVPDPFLNVIHIINGPYKENVGCELYHIDFGTAPAEAFIELIMFVSRNDVAVIIIK
jgi:hypothetical protein